MTYSHAQRVAETLDAPVRCPVCHSVEPSTRCSCGAYVISAGLRARVLNSNDSLHYRVRGPIVKIWREAASWLCKSAKIPPLSAATIYVEYCPPDNRRRDSGNIAPTAKAIVDGVVDAGVIPDDDWKHCDGPLLSIGPKTRPANVTLAIVPKAEEGSK